jgi:hypothetical protein
MRRLALAAFLLALSLAGFAFVQRDDDPVERTADEFRYDALRWEARTLPDALLQSLTPWRQPEPGSEVSSARVDEYFQTARLTAKAYQDLRRIAASDPAFANRAAVEAGLAEQEAARARIAPDAVAVLQSQLEEAIIAKRLGPSLPGGLALSVAWPPVRFVLEPPPRVLVVSPRDRIQLERQIPLRPEMTLADAEGLESEVEVMGFSALVEELGGFASYPAAIPFGYSLQTTLTLAAHEWVHHYLVFRPLGWVYDDSPRLHAANETLADMVGQELAQEVLQRYYSRAAEPSAGTTPTRTADPTRLDFGAFMRVTRMEVDALLEAGRVREAEDYMELQRQALLAHGYSLRRLNQAYFAFHGTYATGPVSVDPLGPSLRALRERSGDLRTFLLAVSGVNSDEGLRSLLQAP